MIDPDVLIETLRDLAPDNSWRIRFDTDGNGVLANDTTRLGGDLRRLYFSAEETVAGVVEKAISDLAHFGDLPGPPADQVDHVKAERERLRKERAAATLAKNIAEKEAKKLAEAIAGSRLVEERPSHGGSVSVTFSSRCPVEEMHVLEPERSVCLAEEVCSLDDPEPPEFADRSGWMRFARPDAGRSRFLTR